MEAGSGFAEILLSKSWVSSFTSSTLLITLSLSRAIHFFFIACANPNFPDSPSNCLITMRFKKKIKSKIPSALISIFLPWVPIPMWHTLENLCFCIPPLALSKQVLQTIFAQALPFRMLGERKGLQLRSFILVNEINVNKKITLWSICFCFAKALELLMEGDSDKLSNTTLSITDLSTLIFFVVAPANPRHRKLRFAVRTWRNQKSYSLQIKLHYLRCRLR